MSADHESSYYEIALTNRQVLTIFVVLLTCLVAAFLSGVWIGRGDAGETALEATIADTPEEPQTAQLTELNFFSEGQRGDGGSKAQSPSPRPAPPPSQEPPATTEPPASEESQPSQEPPPAAPTTEPPAAEPQPPAPQPAPPPSPATAAGRVIQVFSTADAGQADKLVKRLGAGGYPAFLVEERLQGRTTYRVRVGPYQQEAKAQQIADQLRRQYRLDTWITSQPG